MAQALYAKILESRIFENQQEAIDWGKNKKTEYTQASVPVKVDTNPVDATRRRWKTTVFTKV